MTHKTTAYYDGEGVYAWSCTCGTARSDLLSLLEASADGVLHELDEAVTASRQAREEV